MTTANKITVTRIVFIPVFVVLIIYYVRTGNEYCRLAGVVTFAVASILDGVDGYVARHYNQKSELGTILDPAADKLLLVSAIVLLSFDNEPRLGQIPLWLTGVIIGRDMILAMGAVLIRLVVGAITVKPHMTGKVATVFQMVMVVWLLLRWDVVFPPVWIKIWIWGAGVLTAASGWLYFWDGMHQLGKHPSSVAQVEKDMKTGQ